MHAWVTRTARYADWLVVPFLVLVGLAEVGSRTGGSERWAETGWMFALTLPLLARRRWPASAAVVLATAGLLHEAASRVDAPFVAVVLAVLLGFYSAGAWATRTPALIALAAGLTAFWASDTIDGHGPSEYFSSAVLVLGTWGAGRALRGVRAQNDRLRALAEELATEREARARDAVLAERARIAREMHDVVGHSLSVVSLQAQAAEAALDHDPALVREPLAAIRTATTDAMHEMRRLLAVLDPGESGDAAPAPALRELPALVAQHRSTGLDVALAMHGETAEAQQVPAGIQLAAYRIVQEGLTNIRRHTASTHASVAVSLAADRALVEVVDDGPAIGATVLGGHGLVGVRARAAACGGSVEAGPCGTGWRLRASLPYDAAPAT